MDDSTPGPRVYGVDSVSHFPIVEKDGSIWKVVAEVSIDRIEMQS